MKSVAKSMVDRFIVIIVPSTASNFFKDTIILLVCFLLEKNAMTSFLIRLSLEK